MPSQSAGEPELHRDDFRALAEWRYQIRKFLALTEGAARSVGIEPQQHQLLLAVKGLPDGLLPTMGVIAERMVVRPHTVVELVDRLAQRGLIRREPYSKDRRSVLLVLTRRAEWLLHRLSDEHRRQLERSGPELIQSISSVLAPSYSDPALGSAALDQPFHVLCVDDEPRLLQGLRFNLESRYRVSTATSGEEALAICAADPPGVIVSDLRMPDMDGTTFLSQVRERTPTAVRILLTGHADLEAAFAAVNEAQVFRLLTKPCGLAALRTVLEAARDEHYNLVGAKGVLG